MKKIAYLMIYSFIIVASVMACDNDEKKHPAVDEYILSAEVLNKKTGEVKVDNFGKRITIELVKNQDKSNVRIKLGLASGVNMVSPEAAEAVYDLRQQATLKISAANTQYTYYIVLIEIDGEPGSEEYRGWPLTTEFGELPEGINVYKSPAQLQNKNAVAFIAVADISKGCTFDVLGEATGLKTPTEYYESTNKIHPVVINGGYFWLTTNLSLIIRNGEFIAINNQVVTRKNASGTDASFYPTRGVFGRIENTQYQTDWVFTTVSPGTTFAYPTPSPNKEGADPMQAPSATYPEGAWEYKAQTAIGGGPVLVKNSKLENTWQAELYDAASGIGPTSNNPRTAIGVTADNKLILFVCEGRNQTPGVLGFTLEETAKIMIDLGCTEVLNLDGGGSTCMLVNGKETIKPSDTGNKQRSVVSAVVLK